MKYFKLTTPCVAGIVLLFVSCDRFKNEAKSKDAQQISELNKKVSKKDEIFKSDLIAVAADSTTVVPAQQTEKDPEQKLQLPQKLSTPEPKVDWDKKIIKIATLKLELKDYKVYNEQIRKSVKQFGGYIAQEEQTQSDERIENTVTIKVPVEQFEEAMNSLPAANAKVIERKVTSEDVTNEYVDVKSRMASRKQVLNKYLDFLKQAKNMEEILQVQNEINEIQENIESAAGRAEYLSHSASFSTINLTYYQLINGAVISDNTSSFFYKLKDAFKNGLSWIGEIVIVLASIWPLMLIILTGVFMYKKFRKQAVKTA